MLGIRHKIPKVRNGATTEQVNLFIFQKREQTEHTADAKCVFNRQYLEAKSILS